MTLKLDELIPKLPPLDPTSNEMVQNLKALEDLFRIMLEHSSKEEEREILYLHET